MSAEPAMRVANHKKVMKITRRILWMIYAVPFTLLNLPGDFVFMYQYGPSMFPSATLDFLVSFPATVAMYLHIWDKQSFAPLFWQMYACVFLAWDLTFNIFIAPALTHVPFDPSKLIFGAISIPLYLAVFRYGFRRWPEIPLNIDTN